MNSPVLTKDGERGDIINLNLVEDVIHDVRLKDISPNADGAGDPFTRTATEGSQRGSVGFSS